jgi:hypothetical protein
VATQGTEQQQIPAIGLHCVRLLAGVDGAEFERVMIAEVLPAAADVPGSVNRGGVSVIESQHLVKSADGAEYLWLVKATDAMGSTSFSRAFDRMYDDHRETLERFAERLSSTLFTVLAGHDAGTRDVMGRTVGPPRTGAFV